MNAVTPWKGTLARWPDPTFPGTYFEPDGFYLSFLGVTSRNTDPDEFDDDVILHEFGHAAAEAFSIDHSLGGPHNIDSQVDLRLAWSEGLATYIGSAISGRTQYTDSNGVFQVQESRVMASIMTSMFKTLTAFIVTNEWAVSHILYKAQLENGVQAVFDTMASYSRIAQKQTQNRLP